MQINTILELSMELNQQQFQDIWRHSCFGDFDDDDKYLDDALEESGLLIHYRNSTYKKKVKLVINTALLMDGTDFEVQKLLKRLDKIIAEYFDRQYQLEDFTLSGVVLVTDLTVGRKLDCYLKMLKRIGKVKGFTPTEHDELDRAVCWKGNSNATDFLIYDLQEAVRRKVGTKRFQPAMEESTGVLRAEVHLNKPKAIRCYTDAMDTSRQIEALIVGSKDAFLSVMFRIVPYGDVYKKEEALEIIRQEVADMPLQRRMTRLVVLIPEKRSLLLAQQEINHRRMEDAMKAFAQIGLSPITISKRQDSKHLPNIYDFIE